MQGLISFLSNEFISNKSNKINAIIKDIEVLKLIKKAEKIIQGSYKFY